MLLILPQDDKIDKLYKRTDKSYKINHDFAFYI